MNTEIQWEACPGGERPVNIEGHHADYRGFRLHLWFYHLVCIHPWPEGLHEHWADTLGRRLGHHSEDGFTAWCLLCDTIGEAVALIDALWAESNAALRGAA